MPGAVIGLLIANNILGLTSMFGFITLMGMIMRNEILIFEHANEKMASGMTAREAAMDAGKRRMVPIFLTTATTAVGVIPMIIAGSSFLDARGHYHLCRRHRNACACHHGAACGVLETL